MDEYLGNDFRRGGTMRNTAAPMQVIKEEEMSTDGDVFSMQNLIEQPTHGQTSQSVKDFHKDAIPDEVDYYFFSKISRLLPDVEEESSFEENLEPLSLVFKQYQTRINERNKDKSYSPIPDCSKFTYDLVNSNLLLQDIYMPQDLVMQDDHKEEEKKEDTPSEDKK